MSSATNAVLGSVAAFVYRFLTYTFLRWIPGRHGVVLIPLFFAISSISIAAHPALYNAKLKQQQQQLLKRKKKSSSPSTPKRPQSYAEAASLAPSPAPTSNGSGPPHLSTPRKRRNKSSSNSLHSDYSSAASEDLDSPSSDSTSRSISYPNSDQLPRPTIKTIPRTILTLLIGAPSVSPLLNLISLILNLLLLLASLDLLWSPILSMQEHDLSFVRVGAVDHKSARLVARIPPFPLVPDNDQSSTTASSTTATAVNGSEPTTTEDQKINSDGLWTKDVPEGTGARVAYRPTKPVGRWIMGPEIKVSADRDWVGAVTVDGLWASTEYEYRLLLPTLSNSHHPYFPRLQTFTTFPDPALSSPISPHATGESNSGGTHFTFAATSCVKPGFPYRGPSKKREIRGAKYLLNEVERQGVKFLLFLGDYIYADTPVYPGPKKEAYWTRYRQVFASPWMKALVEKIPMIAIWDDHESFNDWSESVALKHPERFPPAQTAYETYLGQANPAPSVGDTDSTSATMGEDEGGRGVHYYDFRYGDAAFFVWDTRSFRSANKAVDDDSKTMLGERQKVVFLDWLAKVNQTITWKFVVSSVPLMTLWSLTDDTWSAFQTERDALLDVMQYIPNVIVLSGDRHEFAAASIRTTITEFSTSPLSQFYLPIRTLSQSHNRGATGEDILLKYLPDGNSKFSTFEVDTRIANQPVVRVRVTIDGEEAWAVDVHGKQLDIPPPPKGIGSLGKSLLELLGFKRRSWF